MIPKEHSETEKKKERKKEDTRRDVRRERDTRNHSIPVCSEESPYEDIMRKWMPSGQEESPH